MILGLTHHGCIYFLNRGEKEKKEVSYYNSGNIMEAVFRKYLF